MALFWRRWIARKPLVLALGEGAELRQLAMQDASLLFDLTLRNRDRLRRWMRWVDQIRCEDDTRGFVREALRGFRAGRCLQMGIWWQGELVGTIGLFRISGSEPEAEIGYWIDQKAEGHGLVTRSARALTQYAFQQWRVQRVRIRVEPENQRSRAIPERLGFRLLEQVEEDWAGGNCRTLLVYVLDAADLGSI